MKKLLFFCLIAFSILSSNFLFSQTKAIIVGNYCTKTDKFCLHILEGNKFKETFSFDITTITTGSYHIANDILTLSYEGPEKEDTPNRLFGIVTIKEDKLVLKTEDSERKIVLYRK
ncbi:hypothetical protein PFY12_12715 [Chryseobacterium camelliae]|uniref:Uncharacterized protein n=1 Tax=Chryseobacterium camelliae TaxID=1265445 RepID=A0ABY7QJT2_9FLAO|nr:hypothetical protein [Chryseobacterium camelliae]WBV59902.1 hypothetical protein PFY12_12715 [Chryseobacterium camelliae]